MQKNTHLKTIIIFTFVTILLSGCASLGTGGESTQHYMHWSARKKQLYNLKSWYLNAASSIHYQHQFAIIYIDWNQQNSNYTLDIAGPFNLNATRIINNGQRVELWQQNRKIASARNAERLIQKEFGFYLPVSNLKYWIKGVPATNSKYQITLDAYNHLQQLKQQGWEINYSNFASIKGIDLPKNIWLHNGKLNIQIKLVNKKWMI